MGWCAGNCGCGRNCKSCDDFCTQHECGKCEDVREAKELEMKKLKEENERLKSMENPLHNKAASETKLPKPFQCKSIDEWADVCLNTAHEAGWGKVEYNGISLEEIIKYIPVIKDLYEGWVFSAGHGNIVGELSELWEAFRKHQLNEPCDKAAKMKELGLRPLTCLEEELADIVIRTIELAKKLGVENIEECIHAKNEYNKTRSHKHGGKLV